MEDTTIWGDNVWGPKLMGGTVNLKKAKAKNLQANLIACIMYNVNFSMYKNNKK